MTIRVIVEFSSDGDGISSALYSVRLDGGAYVSQSYSGLNNAAASAIGVGHSPGSALFHVGDIAEVILYDSLLSDAEVNNIGAAMAAEWGIESGYVASGGAVPEPATLALLGLGAVALVMRRRA